MLYIGVKRLRDGTPGAIQGTAERRFSCLTAKAASGKEVEGPLKTFMKRVFQGNGIPYSLMHHCSSCDPNLQVADYFCWAVHRKLVKGLDWPYSVIEGFVKERGIASIKESGDA